MKPYFRISILLFVPLLFWAAAAPGEEVVKVKRGDLRITLDQEGSFVPADPEELKFWPDAYKGALVIEEVVKNGKTVRKGDVLLRFEKEPIEEMLTTKELDLKAAQLRLQEVRESHGMLGMEMELARESAGHTFKWAKERLDRYREVELRLSDEEYNQGRQYSEDSIQDQKEEIAQLGKMYSEDELTEETEEIVLRRAKRALERSIKRLELQDQRREISLSHRPEQLQSMEMNVRTNELALRRLEAKQKIQRELQEIDLRKKEMEFQKQAKDLEDLRKDQEKFVLYAPQGGIVFHGGAEALGQKTFKVKDSCPPYAALLTLVGPGEIKAQCMVEEKSLFSLRPNMRVKVKPVVLPDAELSGILEPLDLLPEKGNQWKAVAKLDETDSRLIPGMKCKMEIFMEEIRNALLVPKAAVFEKEGKKVCYVKKGDGHEVREVEVGKTDSQSVAVLSGLSEGEEVFLKEPQGK